jgi:hypothetical protein
MCPSPARCAWTRSRCRRRCSSRHRRAVRADSLRQDGDRRSDDRAPGVNTLVLVHRTELLKQWQERLQLLSLGVGKGVVGTIGGGKAKPTGKIDIAVMQSLSRQGEVNPLVENYGQVIVDECHHVGAVSFDAILKRTKAKYVLGLTATPIRRDGQQPIIFMQCGPIRYTAVRRPVRRTIWKWCRVHLPRGSICHRSGHPGRVSASCQRPPPEPGHRRRSRVPSSRARKVLVLTERTEHLDAINMALTGSASGAVRVARPHVKKQRAPDRLTWMTCRQMRRASFFPPANWSARASITRRSTRWCWRCLSPGRARCSSTPGACTGSTPIKPTCGSSTSSTRGIRRC